MIKLGFKTSNRNLLDILFYFTIISLLFLFLVVRESFAVSITKVRSFSDYRIDSPGWNGWRLFLRAVVDDDSDPENEFNPANISSVVADELNGVDPNDPYTLNYSSGRQHYVRSRPMPVSEGTLSTPLHYQFTATPFAGDPVTMTDAPINIIRKLGWDNVNDMERSLNPAVSDYGLTPTFTFDTTPDADKYKMLIANADNSENVYESDWVVTSSPSFTVPAGVLEYGTTYQFRAHAGDFNTGDSDGIDDLENRFVHFLAVTTVPEPGTLLLLGSGLIGLAGVRRKFKK